MLGGEAYQAQAAEQSIRELVVQPARGLIVDDMGRPLVANRTSWVVSLDRTMLHKMGQDEQATLVARLSRAVGRTGPVDPGADAAVRRGGLGRRHLLERLALPAGPGPPSDVRQQVAVSIMEQGEDFPAVLVESQNVRAYPAPYGINAAHVLGYLSPITSDELEEAKADNDTSVHGASVVGRAGLEKQYDRFLRGQPGYKRVAVDSMGRVLGDSRRGRGPRRRHLVTSIDSRVQGVVEQQLDQTIKTARKTFDKVTGRQELRRRLRGGGRDGRQERPRRRDGRCADLRPEGVGRRHHLQAARPALLGEVRQPAAVPRHPGPVSRRGRRGSRS